MEITVNCSLAIEIEQIFSIMIGEQECAVYAQTAAGEKIYIVFDSVWDCRYTIENGCINRWSKLVHRVKKRSSIIRVQNSEYIKYFEQQVSGTMFMEKLNDYIIFDKIDTVFEVLANEEPYISLTPPTF